MRTHNQPPGFTIIEGIVAILVIGAIALAAGTYLSGSAFRAAAHDRLRATLLAENMLEAARALPPGEITMRTTGAPLGTLMTWGKFSVIPVAGAPSGPRALATVSTTTAVANVTSAIAVPTDTLDKTDLTASVRVPSGAATGWRAGLLFRARDLENGYRFTIGASSELLEKVVRGAATTLWTKNITNSAGTWYTLSVLATTSTIQLFRNSTLEATVSDATFPYGTPALIGINSLPAFDSVTVALEYHWDFSHYASGTLPNEWRRLSPADIPSGLADLTVASTTTSSSLKTVTARVRWASPRGPETATATTFHR